MKGVHLGSYWMGKNDVVYTMASDFKHYFDVEMVDIGIYFTNSEGTVKAREENEAFFEIKNDKLGASGKLYSLIVFLRSYRLLNKPINYFWWQARKLKNFIPKFIFNGGSLWNGYHPKRQIKHSYLLQLLEDYSPDFIITNSAGIHFSDDDVMLLKKKGVTTVCISLSDPDVFEQNAKFYGHKFDLCFTNSKKSLNEQYPEVCTKNAYLLPFAASDRCHFPERNQKKEFDVVVVGHARPDRTPIVAALKKKFKVGLYGEGWEDGLGVVNGDEQRLAINKGRIYLSFAKTMAGFTNVKVGLFEAMACKTVVVTDYMEEVLDYFKNGSEILMYKSIEELVSAVELIVSEPDRREWIAKNSYESFCEKHSLKMRLEFIMDKIRQVRNEK